MAVSSNNRVFYAAHSVAIKDSDGSHTWGTGDLVQGAQSVGMTANINLNPVFSLGRIGLYENVEGLPDVEVTVSKVLDGYCPAYLLATSDAPNPTLAGRSSSRCDVMVAVYPDTNQYASGNPLALCMSSGMFVNSVSYNFAVGSSFTEEVSCVGNDRIWVTGDGTTTPSTVPNFNQSDLNLNIPSITWNAYMSANASPRAIVGVAQTQDFIFDLPAGTLTADSNGAVNHADVSVIPLEIAGVTSSGTVPSTNGIYDVSISSITSSVNLNRENIDQLGKRGPYARIVTFPVEVTTEFVVTNRLGDLVTLTEGGAFGTGAGLCSADRRNVNNNTIRLCSCDGLRVYLGRDNKLASVNYQGGDAGGGNVTTTYNYSTYDDFVVMHQNDVNASGATWWTNRNTNQYIVE